MRTSELMSFIMVLYLLHISHLYDFVVVFIRDLVALSILSIYM